MKAADLFCGAGGASLGIVDAGFRVETAIDTSEHALGTHEHNLAGETVQHDLADVDESLVGDVDYLHASPPCKGFSTAGQMDADDDRNALVWTTLDWIDAVQPTVATIENVPEMMDETTGQRLRSRFADAGYSCTWSVLDAADYGVPQHRERLFIVATRNELAPSLPSPTHGATGQQTLGGNELEAWRTVGDVLDETASDGGAVLNHTTPTHTEEVTDRLARLGRGESVSDLPDPGTNKQAQFRLDPSEPSRTLTGGESDLVHPFKDRTLSVREMARLQSFPDWFEFTGPRTSGGKRRQEVNAQTEQVGNAVPPEMMVSIADHVRGLLDPSANGEKSATEET